MKIKKTWKKCISLLMVLCMVWTAFGPYLPSGTVKAADPKEYTVTIGGAEQVFLCNATPTNGPVTITYQVESGSVSEDYMQSGVIATTDPTAIYPYDQGKGSMRFHHLDCWLLNEGYTHIAEIGKDAEGNVTSTITVQGYWDPFSFSSYQPAGTATPDAQYFGIWMANGTGTAKLTNVTCVDKDGNDLGLQTNSNRCVIQDQNEQGGEGGSEVEAVEYTVELSNAENVFLCNDTETDGPVTISYTVESASKIGTRCGAIVTTEPSSLYPYDGTNVGSLQFDNASYILNEGLVHTITISKDSAGVTTGSYKVTGLWGDATYNFSNRAGNGNAASKYFGIWLASATGAADDTITAKLTKVTCVDAKGNDLGLRTNSEKCIISGGKETPEDRPEDESYTKLSFGDYFDYYNGGTLKDSIAAESILAQTNRVDNLDKVKFTGTMKFSDAGVRKQEFRIGGNYDGANNEMYYGIALYLTEDGSLYAWNYYTNKGTYLGNGFQVNNEIPVSMSFTKEEAGKWAVAYYVNDKFVTTEHYQQASNFGKYMYVVAGISFASAEGRNEVKEQTPVSYNLQGSKGYLVTGNCAVTDANGDAVTVDAKNPVITTPGDYVLLTTAGSYQYSRKVTLYLIGDVNLDGTAGQSDDLSALEEMLNGKASIDQLDCAAAYAADLDNNEKVDRKDLELLQSVVNGGTTLERVMEQYHVDALSFDYIGGDEVMPIVGYYGPYSKQIDYINDDIFSKIQKSGINMINYSFNAIGEGNSSAAMKTLELAEKYGIGYFVDDFNLNPEYDANTGKPISSPKLPTVKEFSEMLGEYAYFESFLGTHVADEPSPNGSTLVPDRQLKYFDWTAQQLNQYVNTVGFINVYADNGKGFFDNAKTTYGKYCDDLIQSTDAKVLSFDDYPFVHMSGDKDYSIDLQPCYFKSLWNTRNKAQEYGIPFWGYVQAGGDYAENAHATNPLLQPSEAECYWNVNTMLAFGAKGIEWFPCIQPIFMGQDENGGYDNDRCGLIGIDGTETPFYTYAQKMNQQIAAVDEVLMKAESTGIMATGTTSKKILTNSGVKLLDATGKLRGVSAGNEKYGALVGCFDYRNTEAFYVVNYDTAKNSSDTITLTFNTKYDIQVIQNATAKSMSTTGRELTLTIPSGEAALVVLKTACPHANMTTISEKASTCLEKGWDAYKECQECNQLFMADGTTAIEEIPYRELADHSYTKEVKNEETLKTAGTCKDEALYYYSCSVCDKVEEGNETHTFKGAKDATNHVGGTTVVNASPADHKNQTPGYIGDTKCLGCSEILEKGTSIAPDAHVSEDAWSSDKAYHWKECKVDGCGTVITGTKTEHDITLVDKKEATCEVDGYTGDKVCTVCKFVVEEGKIIPATGHTIVKVEAKQPTYEADGNIEYYKCECGKLFADAEGKTEITDKASVVIPKLPIKAPTIDTTKPVDKVTVGVADNEKTQTIIKDSVAKELQQKIEDAINNGKDVTTQVVVESINVATASEQVKADVTKADEKAKADGLTIASYLDLSIIVKAEDTELGKITETSEKLTFKIAIPEELVKAGREFTVIRIHEGKAETLKTVAEDGYLSFETDAFSTYALSYKDTAGSTNTGDTSNTQNTGTGNSPTTGDNNQMFLWITLMLIFGAVIVGTVVNIRKGRNTEK